MAFPATPCSEVRHRAGSAMNDQPGQSAYAYMSDLRRPHLHPNSGHN
ncbi:hypothetical protein JK207_06755 [Gluconobacter cerinus]|nr:hypothetical protein [Gluconobacter cerinus]MBS0994789.1 hypothetical protein [Gluconobacter cerinus]MBS1021736.1 hypothetical protein [Gluconobacter cerinus]